MFGEYFDEMEAYPSFNVRDLDTLDREASEDVIRYIKEGKFSLLIGHLIGVDHAGHTYSASHKEIERKLNDTEKLLREVIEKMDEQTVLLVFGDHGMTDGGDHGGASKGELSSILFGYTKSGFPWKNRFIKD